MNYHEVYRELLSKYAESLQMGDLTPTPEGACAVTIDDDIIVSLQLAAETGRLSFAIEIGHVEEEHRAKTAVYIAAANVMWTGTAGATLGMDFGGNVVLCYACPVDRLDAPSLTELLDGLVSIAEDWEENLVALRLEEGLDALQDDADEAPETSEAEGRPFDPTTQIFRV